MMELFSRTRTALVAASFAAFGSVAAAATCPADSTGLTSDTPRVFTLNAASGTTANVACYGYGDKDVAGNIGNGSNDPLLDGSTDWTRLGSAISGLQEIDDTGDGGLTYLSGTNLSSGHSGTLTVAASITSAFENLLVAFKFGGTNSFTPDWAVFSITGPGTFNWSQNVTQGELSHTLIYGTPAAIPLPAAGLMLIGALGGLFAVRRRRKVA